MSIVDRAKNILLTPKTEWPVIAAEPASTGSVMTYAAILGLIPAIGSLISSAVFQSALGLGVNFALGSALIGYAIGLGILLLMGIIAGALAPSFDGQNSQLQGLKLIAYASTPVYVAGVLSIIPGLGFIAMIAGMVYGVYLIYLGATSTVSVPAVKTGGYTAVIVVIWIVLQLVISAVILGAVMSAVFGGAMLAGASYG